MKNISPIRVLDFEKSEEPYIILNSMCSQDQIGAPLIKRDPKEATKFWLLGFASSVRPWSAYLGFPMEFFKVSPYADWIRSTT